MVYVCLFLYILYIHLYKLRITLTSVYNVLAEVLRGNVLRHRLGRVEERPGKTVYFASAASAT
jgi:hypothetical protein